MPSFNRVLLLGNLTRDPVLKQLPSQTHVAEFGLAVNRKFRSPQGEDRVDTVFVDCAAFGRIAEIIMQYCHKGRPLFVEGRLRYDSWEDKQGARHSKLSVVAENIQLIGGREESSRAAPQPNKAESQRGENRRPQPVSVKQDDVPF
ncbi:MAG TPA: single-stranded DNA-binding protein [Tepidisphaeraceae bacterium]|jgi:single-strand DNA-binding protein|nr:single-stranded DNA-binding protein [Tepidisphaeraceae bacterium]